MAAAGRAGLRASPAAPARTSEQANKRTSEQANTRRSSRHDVAFHYDRLPLRLRQCVLPAIARRQHALFEQAVRRCARPYAGSCAGAPARLHRRTARCAVRRRGAGDRLWLGHAGGDARPAAWRPRDRRDAVHRAARRRANAPASQTWPIRSICGRRTIATWALARWPEIEPLGFDERFRRLRTNYLRHCEAGFRSGRMDVGLLQLRRAQMPGCSPKNGRCRLERHRNPRSSRWQTLFAFVAPLNPADGWLSVKNVS